MSSKDCCKSEKEPNINVTVNVDVPKIVKYTCITGILIVAFIFSSKNLARMLEKGLMEKIKF